MLKKISRREEADLFVAWMAVSLAFAIIFIVPCGFLSTPVRVNPVTALVFFAISLVTVGIGFILHEMAHKFTAMKFGFYAEFRKDNMMLLVAVALAALVGVVFAAPGATLINPNSRDGRSITRQQNGIISAIGPAVNLLLCIPFLIILLYGAYLSGQIGNLSAFLWDINYVRMLGVIPISQPPVILGIIGVLGIQVNAMIAAFNMLPVSVLDGKKVFAWNKIVFIVLILAAFGALVVSFYPSIL
jgi:Zn-dependent protease